jgi:hypothetical protein
MTIIGALLFCVSSSKPTPLKFYYQMIVLHPDRINPGSWSSALALLGKVPPGDSRSPMPDKTLQ